MRDSGFTAQGVRAEIKRTAVFFANSRLRVVEMGGGGWKRAVLDSNKERFVQKKGFLYIKRRLLRTVKSCSNSGVLVVKTRDF